MLQLYTRLVEEHQREHAGYEAKRAALRPALMAAEEARLAAEEEAAAAEAASRLGGMRSWLSAALGAPEQPAPVRRTKHQRAVLARAAVERRLDEQLGPPPPAPPAPKGGLREGEGVCWVCCQWLPKLQACRHGTDMHCLRSLQAAVPCWGAARLASHAGPCHDYLQACHAMPCSCRRHAMPPWLLAVAPMPCRAMPCCATPPSPRRRLPARLGGQRQEPAHGPLLPVGACCFSPSLGIISLPFCVLSLEMAACGSWVACPDRCAPVPCPGGPANRHCCVF